MSYFAIFPGQGSQSVGMLAGLSQVHPEVKQLYARASDVLDFDLWQLVQEGPEEELNSTANTQPALLVAGVACYQLWQQFELPAPTLLAGHSLGEYTALVCSGALKLEDACKVVALRGRLMQQAVPQGQGAMAAIIGLEDDLVKLICAEVSQGDNNIAVPANFNCPGQIVISGHFEAVQKACQLAEAKEARLCKLLPVSVPSHSPLMASAADELKTALLNINISPPQTRVIHNVDVKSYSKADDIRDALVRQLTQPVRWVDTIKYGITEGVNTTIEFGPGRVLMGLNKRIDRQVRHFSIYDEETLSKTAEQIKIS